MKPATPTILINGKRLPEELSLKDLIGALSQSKNCLLIVSTGDPSITSCLPNEPPSHIHIFDRVPQRELLAYCSLMVTHGGLNSIKECIEYSVPMLGIINPHHKHKDTMGNIARVAFHKIGLKCKITEKPEVLLQKIHKLLGALEFKKNIVFLKRKIDEESKEINFFIANSSNNESKPAYL